MRQKVHVGNLVRLNVWNRPDAPDVSYGLVVYVINNSKSDSYMVMSTDGLWLYDWDEIHEIICD